MGTSLSQQVDDILYPVRWWGISNQVGVLSLDALPYPFQMYLIRQVRAYDVRYCAFWGRF